jgi:hypothetical protein
MSLNGWAYQRFGACVAVALLLTGCALQPRGADPSGAARRTVAELTALRPATLSAALTSAAGEAELFAFEAAAVRAALALPPGAEADEKLPAALQSAALFNIEKDALLPRLLAALPGVAQKDAAYQRVLLTAAHTQYWTETAPAVAAVLPQIKTPREFAIGAYTLLRASDTVVARGALGELLQTNFPDWAAEPRLRALERRLRIDPRDDLATRPPLAELLAAPLQNGYPVVFSFQRRDRERFGLAMVRGADGRFVKNADGSYFNIAQLAMARSNLPGTITNGNTPQGLFVIKGTGTATNRWIGPTPYLESMLPVEAPVALFDAPSADGQSAALTVDENKAAWTEQAYARFLPPSWRGYFPIKEALLAGQAGRDEILAHGNTVNAAYQRGQSYFPAAPSAGCLVAVEHWSKADGTLVHSDQLALVKAFVATGKDVGYLVVVEIDDEARAVQLADVIDAVIAAERGK